MDNPIEAQTQPWQVPQPQQPQYQVQPWQQPPQPKLYDHAISLINNSLIQLNSPDAQRLYNAMNPNCNLNQVISSLKAAAEALGANNRPF